MEPWSWAAAAAGLIVLAASTSLLLERRRSARAIDAKIAASVITRLIVTTTLVWGITRDVRHDDALHVGLALVMGVVALASLFWAAVGAGILLDRSRGYRGHS
jgi:type III secretory pathway component EscT